MNFDYIEILNEYQFNNPTIQFLRHGENKVFQLTDNNEKYIIRIHESIDGFSLKLHQRHYSITEYVEAEMNVLEHVYLNGLLHTQKPIKNIHNEYLTLTKNNTPVTILKWIEGEALKIDTLTDEIVAKLGSTVSLLHTSLKDIETFKRYSYDQELIDHMKIEQEKAYQLHHITKEHLTYMHQSLDQIREIMIELDDIEDSKGLIHSDLGLSNWILQNQTVTPIDFSLCGSGYYLMDISSLLANFEDKNYRKIAIKSYEDASNKKVNTRHLEAFFAFGVMLYITSQHHRLYQEEWFITNMDRWISSILRPFLNHEAFLLV